MLATIWLVVLVAILIAWTWYDARQFAAFRQLEDSAARRACYWRWTWQSFVILTGASVITLLVLGRAGDGFGLPPEFQALGAGLRSDEVQQTEEGRLGFAMGVGIGMAILIAAQAWRLRKMMKPLAPEIEPLFPRNGQERLAVLPLCLNAGFSEELLFRLALPLLIAQVSGSVMIGLIGATVLFGLAHAYQGWAGVLMTMLVGGVFMLLFVRGTSLVELMVLHAAIDVVALIVRPQVARWLAGLRKG
ncbi:MAG: CPBP family intramembrane metalloprotease [Sphingomonadaceae bacterium]|nr:CPBP family intramembrane metalloprotease [Sphingomonadaceae bacterium]